MIAPSCVLSLFVAATVLLIAQSHGVRASRDYSAEWAERAAAACEAMRKKDSVVGACVTIEEAFEEAVEGQAAMMGAAMSISSGEILQRSMDNEFYRKYGDEIIEDVTKWVLDKRVRDEERIKTRLISQVGGWLLKVGAQDTNMHNVGRAREEEAELY